MQNLCNQGFEKANHSHNLLCVAILSLFLSSCATVPGQTNHRSLESHTDERSVDIGDVISDPQFYEQSPVRWGGVVQSIDNRDNETWIEVLERPLNRSGHPQLHSLSHGRFIAVVPRFLDPVDYRKGRAITVSGNLSGVQTGSIGNTDYDFPRVFVADHRLWSPSTFVADRRSSYSPYRSSVSIGIGLGAFHGFRFAHKSRGYLSFRSGYYTGRGYGHKRGRLFNRHGYRNRHFRRW